jgi:hypothetical protein
MEENLYDLPMNEQILYLERYIHFQQLRNRGTMGYKFIAKDSTGNWATGAAMIIRAVLRFQ